MRPQLPLQQERKRFSKKTLVAVEWEQVNEHPRLCADGLGASQSLCFRLRIPRIWRAYSAAKMVVLRGYVCKPQEHDSSGGGSQSDAESDSDDDVDELDWEDLAIGTQGDFRSSTSGSKKRTIHLQILEDEGRKHTSKTRKVSGRFDLRFLEPFWMVTVEVEDKGSLCFANSPGHYRIREDDGVGPDVVSLFLKSSDVNAQHIASFLEFASHASSLRCSLKDLPKNLEAFGDSSPQNGSISFQIQQHLRGSSKLLPLFYVCANFHNHTIILMLSLLLSFASLFIVIIIAITIYTITIITISFLLFWAYVLFSTPELTQNAWLSVTVDHCP